MYLIFLPHRNIALHSSWILKEKTRVIYDLNYATMCLFFNHLET
ncbi:MAG: hypothetical protein RL607_2003 [Bacteroidota bacterium]|jgi:hypothetical protein